MVNVSDRSPFPVLADALASAIGAARSELLAMDDARATRPRAEGKWSPKQVLGHLIDSAANNHQRFVRAPQGASLTLPGYAQEHWVAAQHYNERGWRDLVTLWEAYNAHLVHVIRHVPESARDIPCTIGAGAPVTLGFLVFDYVVHLRHHLDQIV